MFDKFLLSTCIAILILSTAGCGVFSSGYSGIETTKLLILDDGFEFTGNIEMGNTLGLDVRVPSTSGYKLVGASFDPEILSLVHFYEYAENGSHRVEYVFESVADGTTDVLIKMRPLTGGNSELYKRITVNVGKRDTLF